MRNSRRRILGLAASSLLVASIAGPIAQAAAASNSVKPLVAPPATTFVPIDPTRIVDSRDGSGLSGLKGRFKSRVPRTFAVAGIGPIPASAVAVTGNVTVTGQTAAGLVVVGPDPQEEATVGTVDFPLGQNVANNVTTQLSATGTLSATYVAKAGATTSLIFDVRGYFVADDSGATFHPASARIIDSRTGAGQPNFGIDGGQPTKFKAGVPQLFSWSADENCDEPPALPPCEAIALTGTLAVTNQTGSGYLAITPERTSHPSTSDLNFPVRENRSNGVTVEFEGGKPLWIVYVGPVGATADVILDLTGYYTPDLTGLHYYPTPVRQLIDTRSGGATTFGGDFPSSQPEQIDPTDYWTQIGYPIDVPVVTGNLEITRQTAAGHLSITPDSEVAPSTSTINFPKGGSWTEGVIIQTGPDRVGDASFWVAYKAPLRNGTAAILDVTGYFQ